MRIAVERPPKRTRKDGTVSPRIYLYDGTDVVRHTIENVVLKPSEWDRKINRVRFGCSQFTLKNAEIDRVYALARELLLRHPTSSAKALKELLDKGEPSEASLLHVMVEGWIAASENSRTRQSYGTFYRKVKELPPVDMRSVTDGQLSDMLPKLFKGLSPNSRWVVQKHLNKAIAEARVKFGVKASKIRQATLEREKNKEILSWNDVAALLKYQPKDVLEAEALTIAVGMVFTGIRVGDILSLMGTIDVREGILCARFHCSKDPHPEISPIILPPFEDMLIRYGVPVVLDRNKVRKRVQAILKEVTGRHIKLQGLRDSFITNFVSFGTIQEVLLARVFTGHSLKGSDFKVFYGYDRATLSLKQRTILNLLEMVGPEKTAGIGLTRKRKRG